MLGRLWRAVVTRPNKYYVGRDLEGNRFFEYPSTTDDPRRTKRQVEYQKAANKDMWDYALKSGTLPVQWTSWLSHTRPKPPTIEELERDFSRRQRVAANAAILEARDREERNSQQLAASRDVADAPALEEPSERPKATPESTGAADPWKSAKNTEAEPESWAPRTVRRGG